MKNFLIIFLLFVIVEALPAQKADFLRLDKNRSLSLSAWGPYFKQYAGVSHIPDEKSGLRFDFIVAPGYHLRRANVVPTIFSEAQWHNMAAATDLSFYTHRFELEWKDKVYCDVTYSKVSEQTQKVQFHFVNNTDLPQDLCLNTYSAIAYPPLQPYSNVPLIRVNPKLTSDAQWIDATDYIEFGYAKPLPQTNLVYDGQLLGTARVNAAVNGAIIGDSWKGRAFGLDKGDSVVFNVRLPRGLKQPVVALRYRTPKGGSPALKFSGLLQKIITLHDTTAFNLQIVPVGNKLDKGDHVLKISATGNAIVEIDGFLICERDSVTKIRFEIVPFHYKPVLTEKPDGATLQKYADIEKAYSIRWENTKPIFRHFNMEDIAVEHQKSQNKFNKEFYYQTEYTGQGDGYFENHFIPSIVVAPHRDTTLICYLTYGDEEYTENKSLDYKSLPYPAINPAGSKYLFSQQMMNATLSTNVVYPVFTNNTYIKHNTPGRIWDCLYTWDNGFIALGFSALDHQRAIECINTYTKGDNDQSAFLHHGTPLPVQIYAFLELWNKTNDSNLLAYFYPRLKKYYLFLTGQYGSSSMNRFNSNVLVTWDYFYNSGGWDDYPPQVYVHQNHLTATVAPTVNTSHAIRMAKILLMAATEMELKADIQLYKADIERFGNALQQYSWDKESGYFGYVQHDANGKPISILRTANGENLNKGLDGCSPLVAGICSAGQQNAIVGNMMSKGRIWSDQGLSTVDQSASYFLNNGYWNGSVWMPHQWFMWKSLITIGKIEEALQIANTALDVWKREVDETYNCFEVFPIASGRAGGWAQFGALSAPVVNWFESLYVPGTITPGLNIRIMERNIDKEIYAGKYNIQIFNTENDLKNSCLLICLPQDLDYKAFWNNQPINMTKLQPGLWKVTLPSGGSVEIGELKIEKSNIYKNK